MNKLILGTVQFGLDYGINNTDGVVPKNQVSEILDFASEMGVTTLDTAEAYGDAITIIGNYHRKSNKAFSIINKIKSSDRSNFNLETYLKSSLSELHISRYDLLMFHSYLDYKNNPHLFEDLRVAKSKGLTTNLGVSLYTNQELEWVLNDDQVDVIQLPFNLLDNDSVKGKLLRRAKANGKTIHVRSVFLQGLFFRCVSTFPEQLDSLKTHVNTLIDLTKEHDISMSNLALQYVLSKDYIDGVVIGVDSLDQLKENIRVAQLEISPRLIAQIDNITIKNFELLNPSNWNLK